MVQEDIAADRQLPHQGIDKAFYCISLFRRKKFARCIEECTAVLEKNPYDQAVWWLKIKSLVANAWFDDTELEEEGIAEILLDANAMQALPRPGTSLARPQTGSASGVNPAMRPVSSGGRPVTGFARPGTASRPGTRAGTVEGSFRGDRPGTSRPVTSSGRFVRLGTASMLGGGDLFVDLERMDFTKYAGRPALAKALVEYIHYVERQPKKALELASEATKAAQFKDWWWKLQLARAYYQLGVFRSAEQQFRSALTHPDGNVITVHLELAKVYLRLDQPLAALEIYKRASESLPNEVHLLLGSARVYEMIGEMEKATTLHRQVLALDPSNIEAIASLGAHWFYSDHPEVALRLYRRLLQMGVSNAQLWNNVGLCCFYSSQYDYALTCFERALALASEDALVSDIWFNLGVVATVIGDLGLAYQCYKVASILTPTHYESLNNLAILELRKNDTEGARSLFAAACRSSENEAYEPLFNSAIIAFKQGNLKEASEFVTKSLSVYPEHSESKELKFQIGQIFVTL